MIWLLIELDIPQLSSSGIEFKSGVSGAPFQYTYSIQSSSTHSPISLPFDAAALESAIKSKTKKYDAIKNLFGI